MKNQYRTVNNLLLRIERQRRQIGEATMGTLDILPSQHFALVALRCVGRAASQAQIAEMMHVTPASVARTMKSLDRDGYIDRRCGADVRCNEIVVTEKGENVLRESSLLFDELDRKSFDGFSDEELQQMESYLERMLENLSRIRNDMEGEMKK